jgi:hypothetical protein
MKTKILLLLMCVALLATSCATQKQTTSNAACPVYYDGNDEPAASGIFLYSERQ